MAGYAGPLLAVAAIGALGAYTLPQDLHRNIYADLGDCLRDNPQGGCAPDAAGIAGPWHSVSQAAVSAAVVAVERETRRGGFGGWACGRGGGGGGGG